MDFDPIVKKIFVILLSPVEYPGWGCFQLSLLQFFITSAKYLLHMRVAGDLSSKWKVQVSDIAPVRNLTQWAAFVLKHLIPLLLKSLPGSRQSCLNYYISTVQRVKWTGYRGATVFISLQMETFKCFILEASC